MFVLPLVKEAVGLEQTFWYSAVAHRIIRKEEEIGTCQSSNFCVLSLPSMPHPPNHHGSRQQCQHT